MYLSGFERRWSRLIAEGLFCDANIARAHDAQLPVLQRFLTAGNPPARWAYRMGLLLIVLAPLWRWRRFVSLRSLSLAERGALLSELLNHRWYAIRELAFMVKVSLCMMLLGDEQVRASTHYDAQLWEQEPVAQSGQRRRLDVVLVAPANENDEDVEVA